MDYEEYKEKSKIRIKRYRNVKAKDEPNISLVWAKAKNNYESNFNDVANKDLGFKILINTELNKVAIWDFDLDYRSHFGKKILNKSKNLLPPSYAMCKTSKGMHFLTDSIENLDQQFKTVDAQKILNHPIPISPLFNEQNNLAFIMYEEIVKKENLLDKIIDTVDSWFSSTAAQQKEIVTKHEFIIRKPTLYNLFQDIKYHFHSVNKGYWGEYLVHKTNFSIREYKKISSSNKFDNYIDCWNDLSILTNEFYSSFNIQGYSLVEKILKIPRDEVIVDWK